MLQFLDYAFYNFKKSLKSSLGNTGKQKAVRILTIIVIIIAVIKIKDALFGKKEVPVDDRVVLQVIEAKKENVSGYIHTYGTASGGKATDIVSEITSTVKEVKIYGHGEVKENQPIIILDPRGAGEEYSGMKVKREIAKADYEAGLELYHKGLISKLELDQLLSKMNDTNAILSNTIDNSNPVIKAPFDGVLTDVYVNKGDLVFKQQTKLFTIVQKKDMEIIMSLPNRHLTDISLKHKILVKTSRNQPLTAQIIRYENVVTPNAGIFTAVAIPVRNKKNSVRLINGESLYITIEKKLNNVVKLPHNVLVLKDEIRGVMIINKDKKTEFFPVTIAFEDAKYIYINNINSGTELIVKGQHFVEPGVILLNNPAYQLKFNDKKNE